MRMVKPVQTESEIKNINVQKVVVEIPYSGYISRVYFEGIIINFCGKTV